MMARKRPSAVADPEDRSLALALHANEAASTTLQKAIFGGYGTGTVFVKFLVLYAMLLLLVDYLSVVYYL